MRNYQGLVPYLLEAEERSIVARGGGCWAGRTGVIMLAITPYSFSPLS